MHEPVAGLCALVMAAGQGSRYRAQLDVDKLLAPWLAESDSPPVLLATLIALQGVAERLVVVASKDNPALLDWLDCHARELNIELCLVQTRGLGHSLSQAVERYPASRGWLVALGDMPYVRPESVVRIAGAMTEDNLVVPVFRGQRGHPRGIGSRHYASLRALDGDSGAQGLFSGPVLELELADPGVLQDIDRPQDRLPQDCLPQGGLSSLIHQCSIP